jgi:flagellar basal body-associated protein FliL
MTKSFKKLFISIISVIAIVCLGASMLFTVQGAKADDSVLSITKVEKVYMHGYNSIDSLGYRSEYNVTFSQDNLPHKSVYYNMHWK